VFKAPKRTPTKMSHIVSRQPWGVIDLDTTAGRIFFQQEWFYTWALFNATVPPWTLHQKRFFHNTLDRQIWSRWSNRVKLQVVGATPFARHFARSGVSINFDIKWVLRPGHYAVTVRKMPAGSDPTTFISFVNFGARHIELDSADLTAYHPANEAGNSAAGDFFAGPHEFGHTLDNPDEYNAVTTALNQMDFSSIPLSLQSLARLARAAAVLADTDSIENVGRQVRPWHLQLIIDTLNTMTPGVTWSPPATIP
jgi:hypothetical protein